jgi:hypothetical protein
MLHSPPIFDDFCGLADADFRGVRLVEFFGVSGAGKSTAIGFLCREHRDFCEREAVVVTPGETDVRDVPDGSLAIVEEVRQPRDLRCVVSLLHRGATALVASHLRPAWSAPLGIRWRRRRFRLDRNWRKISRYLDQQGVGHTTAAVQHFCRRYGANYVDAALIIERRPDATFDAALAHFERFCRLDLNPV